MRVNISSRGGEKLRAKIEEYSVKGKKKFEAELIYNAKYAWKVHEATHIKFKTRINPYATSKFLEKAYARCKQEMQEIIRHQVTVGKRSGKDALVKALQLLWEWSTHYVPVDTGYLRDSARIHTK